MKTAKQNSVPISWSLVGTTQKVPSLTMLVNPANLELSYAPMISETRTLGGFVHEYWGEQLTSLSASGRTAMFIDENGLSNENARNTESYQYFMTLLNIYKNNGKDYYNTYTTVASQRNPTKITGLGYVVMWYDKRQYQGYFEGFNYTEDSANPFNLSYDLSFRAMRIIGQTSVSSGGFKLGAT
jgi:hypothetical protein